MNEIVVAVVSGVVSGFAGGLAGAKIMLGRRSRQSARGGRQIQQTAGDNSPVIGRDFRPK